MEKLTFPPIGMGTWPLRGQKLQLCMEEAISCGYRLFDTADNYGNQADIGAVIARNPGLRKELLIMTKISDEKASNNRWSSTGKYFYKNSTFMKEHSVSQVVDMIINKSLKELQTDYIDVLLMHWPYSDYLCDIWESMIRLYEKGVCRYIGVSNFRERHLEKLKQNFSVFPVVNQICLSPYDTKESLVDYCRKNNVQLLCYAPLQLMTRADFIKSETVVKCVKKYGISPAQLLLAWNASQKIIPIPKSTHLERMKMNAEAVKIRLETEDLKALSDLNRNLQYLPESIYCPGC